MERLGDAELKIMETLWREGELPARRVAEIMSEETGWNKNTTYTLLKRLIDKQALERLEPGFICRALVSRAQIQQKETQAFVNKLFGGSASMLLAALVDGGKLPEEEFVKLRKIIDQAK